MKNICLSFMVLPLFIQSMQRPQVTATSQPVKELTAFEPKKLTFCLQKIQAMTKQFRTAKNRLQFQQTTTKADLQNLKLSYILTGEILSQELMTLVKINPLPVIASIKLNANARRNIIYILHNTDPSSQAPDGKHHEELLWSFNQENTPKTILQWAVDYDKQQLQKGQPQRYGTCLDQNLAVQTPVAGCSPKLLEDDINKINARREAIGLPSIQEQLADAYHKQTMNKHRDC